MPRSDLPQKAPPEVIRFAKAAFSTDELSNSEPVFTIGSDPFLACERAVQAAWRCARIMLAGEAVPDPPGLPRISRCPTCATLRRLVPDEATGELLPLETAKHLDGLVRLVPTPSGMRAHVFPNRIVASVEAGTRYRLHFDDCTNTLEPKPARKPGQSRRQKESAPS